MEVKHFERDMGILPLNPENLRACPQTGLFEEFVEINGVKRAFYTYLNPELVYNRRSLILVPDGKRSVLEYLENSFWLHFARRENIFLHILAPENNDWALDGSDALYMNMVYLQTHSRRYYVTMRDNTYAVGIGTGAVVAQQSAMSITEEWAGLATFGEMDWSASYAITNIPRVERLSRPRTVDDGKKCPLPVWMFWSADSGDNAKVCGYWKTQNNADSERFSNAFADEIYFPSRVCKKGQTEEEPIAQVRVTNDFHGNVNEDVFHTVWNYISLAYRHRCFNGGVLRYAIDPGAYGLEKHTIQFEGYTRIWYEYIPEAVKKRGTPAPLVLAMHGRNGCADMFVSLSGMTRVAEERNFIAVFPEAAAYQQHPGGPRNVLHWCGCNDGEPNNDVDFIRRVIQNVESRYAIDTERVYACGQSSGGMMASELACKAPELFAAVACWSAIWNPDIVRPLPQKIAPTVPYLFLFGDKDRLCSDLENGELEYHAAANVAAFLRQLMKLYNLDTVPLTYQVGEISYYVYLNPEKIPLLTVGVVKNMPHGNYPQESWISYDAFMARYRKNTNGELFYMESRVKQAKNTE